MRHPLRDIDLTWDPQLVPRSFRDILFIAAGSLLEISKALRRIADAQERRLQEERRHDG